MRVKYFNWLCGLVNPHKKPYYELLRTLHDFTFEPLIPNDDNREEDGKKLREEFIDTYEHLDEFHIDSIVFHDCSVLEMMIALCRRLEFETAQSRWEKTPDEWFWILIDNLNLTSFEDHLYKNNEDMDGEAREIIHNLVYRGYKSDGDGGLFPIRYPKYDQKTIEIWYQMSEYIMENYPI